MNNNTRQYITLIDFHSNDFMNCYLTTQ